MPIIMYIFKFYAKNINKNNILRLSLIHIFIDTQRYALLRKMEELQKNLKILDYKHWYYETAKKAGTCKIHENMKKEDIPEKFRDLKK